jgi:hypothetical protein
MQFYIQCDHHFGPLTFYSNDAMVFFIQLTYVDIGDPQLQLELDEFQIQVEM